MMTGTYKNMIWEIEQVHKNRYEIRVKDDIGFLLETESHRTSEFKNELDSYDIETMEIRLNEMLERWVD
jgi:hypothetical protein